VLIPVYVVGFIFGGLLCFAIAQRVSNRPLRISLQTIGVVAGPVFFLVVAIFSSQERKKTYEMEWLTGKPAAEYYVHVYGHAYPPDPEAVVMLRREIGNDRVCFSSLNSKTLARYLETLPTHSIKVQYAATYDFYQLRGVRLESVGDFGRDPTTAKQMGMGDVGLRAHLNVYGSFKPCFPW
jgi:hypothetical protein